MSPGPDLDRVRDLLGHIADSARRLRELSELPSDGFLDDPRNPAAAKYLAIVGAASAIDLCNHLVARQGGRAPTDRPAGPCQRSGSRSTVRLFRGGDWTRDSQIARMPTGGSPAMAERSRDWIEQAERDLEQARWSAKGGFHEWACFAAQQSAEKAVKAIYQRLGGETRGHSVAALLRGLAERLSIDEELLNCGRALDRFYVPARSPNGWPEGAPKQYFAAEDADRAIGCGDEILRFCQGQLAESS